MMNQIQNYPLSIVNLIFPLCWSFISWLPMVQKNRNRPTQFGQLVPGFCFGQRLLAAWPCGLWEVCIGQAGRRVLGVFWKELCGLSRLQKGFKQLIWKGYYEPCCVWGGIDSVVCGQGSSFGCWTHWLFFRFATTICIEMYWILVFLHCLSNAWNMNGRGLNRVVLKTVGWCCVCSRREGSRPGGIWLASWVMAFQALVAWSSSSFMKRALAQLIQNWLQSSGRVPFVF